MSPSVRWPVLWLVLWLVLWRLGTFVRGDCATASLSQAAFDEASASDDHAPASDLLEGSSPGRRRDGPPRSPGMHLGHDLLHALTFAVALFATLLLNAIHC